MVWEHFSDSILILLPIWTTSWAEPELYALLNTLCTSCMVFKILILKSASIKQRISDHICLRYWCRIISVTDVLIHRFKLVHRGSNPLTRSLFKRDPCVLSNQSTRYAVNQLCTINCWVGGLMGFHSCLNGPFIAQVVVEERSISL